MREVKVKAAAPAALRRKVRRPARSIACSSLGMTANHGNAGETGGGKKPTKTGVMALTGGEECGFLRDRPGSGATQPLPSEHFPGFTARPPSTRNQPRSVRHTDGF